MTTALIAQDLSGDLVARLAANCIEQLELLLRRHADFDTYLRERGKA